MKGLEWYIARRYLSSRRRGRFLSLISLIAVGGVTLGVTALLTVIAVMTGLQRDLQAKILGNNPHVYVFEAGGAFRLGSPDLVLEKVRAQPGVVGASPFIMTQVVVVKESLDYAQFGQLFGISTDPSDPPITDIQRQISAGELALGPTQSGLPGILLGSKLAMRLGAVPGSIVTVVSGENIKTDALGGLAPVTREFEVTGTFETGMYDYDNQHLYTGIPAAQDLLGLPPDTVGGIAVNVGDAWNAQAVALEIDRSLGYRYYTQDWMEINGPLFSALKLEKLAMGVILSLIILVAAFNIISTLTMVVADKTREIGILKSMGMTDWQIQQVFMLQGLTVGLVGTTLGTAGGLLLIWLLDRYEFIKIPGDVYFVDTLPVALDPRDLVLTVVVSILIAFVATIYPSRQASRLQPVEAIRHE